MPGGRAGTTGVRLARRQYRLDWKLLLSHRERSRLRPICCGVNDLVTTLCSITRPKDAERRVKAATDNIFNYLNFPRVCLSRASTENPRADIELQSAVSSVQCPRNAARFPVENTYSCAIIAPFLPFLTFCT